jgi:23S rRNA (cytidine1920-2'-O)/16S rRNA (cytidine1409-2'-O)-methyltransferase
VRDPGLHRRVIEEILAAGAAVNLSARDVFLSPVPGAEGNKEFFLHFRNQASSEAPDLTDRIQEATQR